MRFIWDDGKSARNERERGLPFTLAQRLFDGPIVEADDPRDWGERRVKAIGVIDGREYVVIYTDRKDGRRIISFRDAKRQERRTFWLALRARAGDG
jgi:uncharacterized DUF497 family protein